MAPGIVLCLILFPLVATAQSSEVDVLGGRCLGEMPGETPGWHDLVSRQLKEQKSGKPDAAIDLAKQVVRGACSNEHWWLRLAELLAQNGRERETVLALDALYGRHPHAVHERLRSEKSPLYQLIVRRTFQGSALAARLRADEEARRKRIGEATARLRRTPSPPFDYVASKACPFECCRFGTWTATANTVLYDKPGGTAAVATVAKGKRVTALTGEVHLRPVPVRARGGKVEGGPVLRDGQIVFLLDHLGEGHRHLWVDGKIVSGFDGVRRLCPSFAADCWGEFLDEDLDAASERAAHVWWVKIRLRPGVAGWTRQSGHFSGADACG